MIELNIKSKSPAALTGALKKIKEMTTSGQINKKQPIRIIMEAGTYREIIRYNLSNPLIIEGNPNCSPEDIVVQAENCEAFNHGIENRSVFYLGPNVTTITLRNFSIVNSHLKSDENEKEIEDAAEALVWNNTTGILVCDKMKIESRMNTLCLKGNSRFSNSYISGDSDFIYGDCDTALFENCEIHLREDNRGDYDGFVVKGCVFANKPGFVFKDCNFTAVKRRRGQLFIYKTEGRGSATAIKGWDSIALINCGVSEVFNPEFFWDNDMDLNLYPRGNAKTGPREYKTSTIAKNGKTSEADNSRRNVKAYTITDKDYYELYASRYLILKNTPFNVNFY